MKSSAFWCYLIAGWSGFYVMLVELLSGRLIAPFFGSSIYVWGAVIFVFMLGLAIGYLLGGIYSRRNPSLRRLAGILACGALVTSPAVLFAEPALNWIFDHVPDPRAGSLLTCFLLYFVPSILAGMVSPYAIRLIVSDTESSGRNAGLLYFVSTVGSSAGTLLTSFFFVLWFEVNTIIIAAMSFSLALAPAATALAAGNKAEAKPA